MKKIKTIIIEDVDKNAELLKGMLKTCCPEVHLVGIAASVEAALELIKTQKPTLLFCDIQIDGGTSFDILEHIMQTEGTIDFEVVFLTGHKKFEYVTKSFEYSALGFLFKPIDRIELRKAVERALEKLDVEQYTHQIQFFLESLKKEDTKNTQIIVHLSKQVIEPIEIGNILYIKADGILSEFYLTDGRVLKAFRNLGAYRKILELDHNFFSISDSISANLDYIKNYSPTDKILTLKNGVKLTASKRGGQSLRNHLTSKEISPPAPQPAPEKSLLALLKKIIRGK